MEFNNRNDRQVYFNQIKGSIFELNDGDRFCNITLLVGHENCRYVNFALRKEEYDKLVAIHKLGDKVVVRFYLTSKKKNDKWYTMANMLDIQKEQ